MPGDVDDKTKDLDLSKHPQFLQLAGVMTQLGKNFQALQAAVQGQGSNLDKLVTAMKEGGGKPNGKPPEEKPLTDKDVDEMSQSQLVAHMFKGMRTMLTDTTKEFGTKIENLSANFEKKNLMSEVDQMRSAHKDFDDWIPEIKEKMTASPTLSLDEAYTLVRKANATKSTEMDTKYKVGLDDKEKDKDKDVFGGLLPTSGGGKNLDDDGKPTTLTAKEAGDKAWEEVFGDHPNLAGPDDQD
jgi:hypothetical protein